MSAERKVTMKERLFELSLSNIISNAINIGNRLELFKKLAQISNESEPVGPRELAEASGCKEKYIKFWLSCLACGNILEVNSEGKFWIDEQNVEDLTSDNFELQSHGMLPVLLEPLDQLIECFKNEGPAGLKYPESSGFHDFMHKMSTRLHEKHVVPDIVPAIDIDLAHKLNVERLRVLDVACGGGFHTQLLADAFPYSHFTGVDSGEEPLRKASVMRKKCGDRYRNLNFVYCGSDKLDASWDDTFDMVLHFETDSPTGQNLNVEEIHRVLKPGGLFAVVEVIGSSDVFTDKQTFGKRAAMMYGCALLHNVPPGASSTEDSLGYGGLWGQKRATELLKQCGFEEVRVLETPHFPINVMYVAKKKTEEAN